MHPKEGVAAVCMLPRDLVQKGFRGGWIRDDGKVSSKGRNIPKLSA